MEPEKNHDDRLAKAGEPVELLWCGRCRGYHRYADAVDCTPELPAPLVVPEWDQPGPTDRPPPKEGS